MLHPVVDRSNIPRKALGEFLGTGFLVAAVVGSGIAAQQLSPHDVGLELFENTIATATALVAIILAIGPVSGAHLNPVITLIDRVFGGVSNEDVVVYITAQFAGGICGALAANTMFGGAVVSLSTDHRASGPRLFAEALATFGLVLVVFGVVRSGRSNIAPFAVGAYIAAGYWFTSSTSVANPAVALARMLSNTFSGIAPSSVGPFVIAQIVGGGLGACCIAVLYPRVRDGARDVVVPHGEVA